MLFAWFVYSDDRWFDVDWQRAADPGGWPFQKCSTQNMSQAAT
jgi:hypothetical protein